MKVEQAFTVARPSDDVWAFFQDIPNVATCMPGAEMTGEKAPGVYGGKISLKLGPFGASFDGEATVKFDDAARTGHVEGKGVDKRGGSRSRMVASPGTTNVTVDADVTLSGAIAQFGRTGIIQETANILIGEFVTRLEERLAPPAQAEQAASPPEARPATRSGQLSVSRLVIMALKAWIARLFRRPA